MKIMQSSYELSKLLKEKLCEEYGEYCCYDNNGEIYICPAAEEEGSCCLNWVINSLKEKNDWMIKQQQIENEKLELMSILTSYLNKCLSVR